MSPVIHRSTASPNAASPAGRDAPHQREGDMANFDLRVTLADMTVRETSFAEFLAALKKIGHAQR
jgi:hypothetical protein